MSGFQIPGLGFAQPNEKLPPLPTEQTTTNSAEANTSQDIEIQDAASASETTNAPTTAAEPRSNETQNDTSNAMVIDQPESPPSLTGALEAALGGLDPEKEPENAEQALGQFPAEQIQQVTEGPNAAAQGEHPEWEADSSPYESSSESSSSDSSDEDDSDNEGYELLGVEETARLLMEAEGGSDDEGEKSGKGTSSAHVRSKNELPEEVIPKPDVIITPEMKVEELGAVEHIVENLMLIKAFTPGEYQVLDTGSVLCTADRVVIGAVAETIGKVLQPMYTVHFNSGEEIKDFGIEVGTKIYYPSDHATFVFTEPLKNMKGSDASNLHDEEVGDEEMEFSDDEKEAEYKRSLKQKKREKWKNAKGDKEQQQQPHPLRQEISTDGGLNYDDDDDGPYKPLTRPPGFGNGPVSTETYDSQLRRGRGRDSRGRGGRGRGSGRGGRGGGGSQPRNDGYSLPPQGSHNAVPPPPPPPQWNQNGTNMPAMPNFGFQIPGWPQAGQSSNSATPPVPPPPVPNQQGGNAQNGAFLNPAFFAALMSMQAQQNGGQNWQPPPPPPPPPSGGQ